MITQEEREKIFQEETERRAEEKKLKEEAHLKAASDALNEWAEKFGVALVTMYQPQGDDKPSIGVPKIILTKEVK